jgi:hypothetical protein
LVDAPDSKSGAPKGACRFEPDLRYSLSPFKTNESSITLATLSCMMESTYTSLTSHRWIFEDRPGSIKRRPDRSGKGDDAAHPRLLVVALRNVLTRRAGRVATSYPRMCLEVAIPEIRLYDPAQARTDRRTGAHSSQSIRESRGREMGRDGSRGAGRLFFFVRTSGQATGRHAHLWQTYCKVPKSPLEKSNHHQGCA